MSNEATFTLAEAINHLQPLSKALETSLNSDNRTREELAAVKATIDNARKAGGERAAEMMQSILDEAIDSQKDERRKALAQGIVSIARKQGIHLSIEDDNSTRGSSKLTAKGTRQRRPKIDLDAYTEKVKSATASLKKDETITKSEILDKAGIASDELNPVQWGSVAKEAGLSSNGRGKGATWSIA